MSRKGRVQVYGPVAAQGRTTVDNDVLTLLVEGLLRQ